MIFYARKKLVKVAKNSCYSQHTFKQHIVFFSFNETVTDTNATAPPKYEPLTVNLKYLQGTSSTLVVG